MKRSLIALASLGVTALATPAIAAPCADLPNPVYLQIGDTQQPLIKQLGRALRDATDPISLVYITSGSCTNVSTMYAADGRITVNALYIPSTVENATWKTTDPALSCDIPADPGVPVDIANSNVFVSACDPSTPPTNLAILDGPIQAYAMVVPQNSTQTAITAAEAYFVFGWGAAGEVAPWNDEALMFIRTVTKSTIVSWAAAIGVPVDKWKGTRFDKSTDVINALVAASDPEKAIGILGVELYDGKRNLLNALAYQAFGQFFAYYPDSTSTAHDKQNLRDGHYTVWSPTVWMYKIDPATGDALNANAKYVADLILGNVVSPEPAFRPLDMVIGNGLVPECAMKVSRTFEAGPLSLYSPDAPCGCYFDSLTSQTSCNVCTINENCNGGSAGPKQCRLGYCEAK